MRALLRAIYRFLTAPLYRRLSHEMSVKLQAQTDAQLQFQERFIHRVLDDLVVLSIQIEEQNRLLQSIFPDCELSRLPEETLDASGLTDEQIVQLVNEVRTAKEFTELADAWDISPLLAAKLKARLHGMSMQNIGLVRSLERENARLTNVIAVKNEIVDARPKRLSADIGS